jgi:hypothetical protein
MERTLPLADALEQNEIQVVDGQGEESQFQRGSSKPERAVTQTIIISILNHAHYKSTSAADAS